MHSGEMDCSPAKCHGSDWDSYTGLQGHIPHTLTNWAISTPWYWLVTAHSWWLYSAAPLGNQANNTMTWYHTQSHYLDTEPTSPCPILIMPSTLLGSNKHQFYKLLLWLDHGFEPTISHMWDRYSTDSVTAPGEIYMVVIFTCKFL